MTISVRGLSHRYDGQQNHAVDNLDLGVQNGEFYVLLGPSGCGKTTTMRCIAGLETPVAGQIDVGGRTVVNAEKNHYVPVHKRHIGMVFQSYAIWPHKTVFENVAFPLRMQGVDSQSTSTQVSQVLQKVGLSGYEKRGASMLSGGQMQRVALARSIAMRPTVLLFDEPLSNLDARLRESLRFELRAIQQEFGFTAMYVTHDQSEAMALGDRIAVMRDGRIVQEGDPMSLYREPNSKFVAEFLGVGNIFDGEVVARHDETVRIRVDGSSLELTAAGSTPVGERVTACIRDEEVVLEPRMSTDASTDNLIAGTVGVASFLGRETRYQCVLDDGTKVGSSMPSTSRYHASGTQVTIRVPKESVQLVSTDDELSGVVATS